MKMHLDKRGTPKSMYRVTQSKKKTESLWCILLSPRRLQRPPIMRKNSSTQVARQSYSNLKDYQNPRLEKKKNLCRLKIAAKFVVV